VASVDADFDTKTATITTQPGRTITQADCEKAFEGSRYGVASFEEVSASP